MLEPINLGRAIAEQRKFCGMTQKELAEKLCVTDKAISKWETGAGYPDITILPELSQALAISIDHLMGNPPMPEEPCGRPSANEGANPHPHQFNVEAATACTDGFTAAPDGTGGAEKQRETVPERPAALLQAVCSRNTGLAPYLFLCGLCFFASLLVFTLESVQYSSQGISGYIFLAGLLLCTLLAPMFLAKRYRLVKTFGLLTPILPFVTTLIGWLPSGESWIFFNLILLSYCWLCLFLFWLFQTKPYLPLAVGLALLPFVMQFLRCQT